MPFIPKPLFPNVPQLPGVPQLVRAPGVPALVNTTPPTLNDTIPHGRLALALTTQPVWGIYRIAPSASPDTVNNDNLQEVVIAPQPDPVIVPDNFSRMDYDQNWDVGTAPVAEGGFASFNKVSSPYTLKLRMTKGGTLKQRQEFVDKMEVIGASLDLYRIVTPERVYTGVNIFNCRVVREGASGAYFFAEVEISFLEIRQATAEYTSTAQNTQNSKNPSARPVSNSGTVNSTPATKQVQSAVGKKLGY